MKGLISLPIQTDIKKIMEEEDEKELDTRYDIPARIIVALIFLSIPAFFISYNMQENKITDQLNECSFYTMKLFKLLFFC